jgi:hypothetical protein
MSACADIAPGLLILKFIKSKPRLRRAFSLLTKKNHKKNILVELQN